MKITLSHGSGGRETSGLIEDIFRRANSNAVLDMPEDCAVVDGNAGNAGGRIAVTTDSFVVTPLFFRGGDIGRLSVCGTVNDLLMRGAVPKYITSAYIIETGADTDTLEKIARSMSETAREAGVAVIAGDTKVIEGSGGVYINTTGIGFVPDGVDIKSSGCKVGDAVILSGTLGDHHAAILSERMSIENEIKSDCAPLCEMVLNMIDAGVEIHAMRDVTRGGLGTILNELAASSGCGFEIDEAALPVNETVRGFAKILGMNLMHMGNEGKLAAVVAPGDAERTLEIVKNSRYGENAAVIGTVTAAGGGNAGGVYSKTPIGGRRVVTELYGEGLPRIC